MREKDSQSLSPSRRRLSSIAVTAGCIGLAAVLIAPAAADRSGIGSRPAGSACFRPAAESAPSGGDEGGIAGDGVGTPACGDASLTHSFDQTTIDGSVSIACLDSGVTRETSYAREFTPDTTFRLSCVTFGVAENAGPAWPVQVRVLTGSVTGTYESLTELASTELVIPADTGPSLHVAEFAEPLELAADETVIIELRSPSRLPAEGGDGGATLLGCNSAGQSAPTFIRGPVCGVPNFLDIASIGFPNSHVLMTLNGWNVNGRLAFGLGHTPIGDTSLTFDADGRVVASGLDRAGAGVHIDFGSFTRPVGVMTFIQPPALEQPGRSIRAEARGVLGGATGQTLHSITVTETATGTDITTDFGPIVPESLRLEAYLDGALVYAADNVQDYQMSARGGWLECLLNGCPPDNWKPTWPSSVTVTITVTVSLAGEQVVEVLADEVAIIAVNPKNPPSALEATAILPTGFESLVFTGAAIETFGTVNTALGNMSFAGVGQALLARPECPKKDRCVHLGSMGEDGSSRITWPDKPNAQAIDIELNCCVAESCCEDPGVGLVEITVHGTVAGVPDQSLGTLILEQLGGGETRLIPDFAVIGSPTYRLQVLDHGTLLLDLPGSVGPAALSFAPPRKIGKLGGQTECFVACMPDFTTMLVAGQVIVANEIRMLAEGSSGAIENKTSMEIRLDENVSFVMVGQEIFEPSPCPADVSGDGVVDGADLGALLNAWGSSNPLFDLNADGTVDGADLGILLNAWGDCR